MKTLEKYVKQPVKKMAFHACEKSGGIAMALGGAGLTLTGLAHYANSEVNKASWADIFFGKMFHYWIPLTKNLSLTTVSN